jgi:hypothetical protein
VVVDLDRDSIVGEVPNNQRYSRRGHRH